MFEEVFIRTGQPYKVVGGVRFYERREVRDAVAYLRMLVNPADEISLRRILNTPKRGIGDRAVACVTALAERERITFWDALRRAEDAPGLASRSLNAITGFVGMVEELQSMVDAGERPDVVLESVLTASGYLAELEASDDPQDETRVENLAELVAVAREFSDDPVAGPSADPADVDAGTVAPGLGDFLERVALVADTDQIPDAPEGGRRRRGHADDPPHRQGPGVPGGVPDRARGRRLPPRALTRRPARARGGAPARVRRRHPRRAAALCLPCGGPLRLGRAVPQPRLALPRRDAGRPGRLAPYRGGPDPVGPPRPRAPVAGRGGAARPRPARRNFSAAAARADAASKAKATREVPSLDAGRPGRSTTRSGMGTVVAVEGVADKAVASIDFGREGVKRLLLRYAPVEKL